MGRAPCCDKSKVKKGPWSPEEDAALRNFIHTFGTGGNWIALPAKAGLKRCGKSCRLRWLNYLRPDIKHGGFTDDEDNIIFTLYNKLGSRWSIIASHLPGRTDNDVKNHWNTKLKKKLAARVTKIDFDEIGFRNPITTAFSFENSTSPAPLLIPETDSDFSYLLNQCSPSIATPYGPTTYTHNSSYATSSSQDSNSGFCSGAVGNSNIPWYGDSSIENLGFSERLGSEISHGFVGEIWPQENIGGFWGFNPNFY